MKLLTTPVAILFLLPLSAEAGKSRNKAEAPSPPSCSETSGETPVEIPIFTGYKPGVGGINGSCSGGALAHKGFKACRNTLDKFVKGNSPFIHVAAQQKGGSAVLFGCWAKTNGFDLRKIPKGPKECAIAAITDHYAGSESEGRRGANGKIQKKKVDVEVDTHSSFYLKLGGEDRPIRGTTFECLRRLPGVTNREKPGGSRVVGRSPAAVKPLRPRG